MNQARKLITTTTILAVITSSTLTTTVEAATKPKAVTRKLITCFTTGNIPVAIKARNCTSVGLNPSPSAKQATPQVTPAGATPSAVGVTGTAQSDVSMFDIPCLMMGTPTTGTVKAEQTCESIGLVTPGTPTGVSAAPKVAAGVQVFRSSNGTCKFPNGAIVGTSGDWCTHDPAKTSATVPPTTAGDTIQMVSPAATPKFDVQACFKSSEYINAQNGRRQADSAMNLAIGIRDKYGNQAQDREAVSYWAGERAYWVARVAEICHQGTN